MTNSILYGNGWSLGQGDSGVLQISYSLVEGGITGTGNIDADPLFVDAANGDYRLVFGSPAIDMGTNDGAPPLDLLGLPRPLDGNFDGTAVADMGAYEWQPFQLFLPLVVRP